MSAHKGLPLTKEEVMQLVELIETTPVLLSKVTNATNNRLKEACWYKIARHFNASISSGPRKPEQLKQKWDNLKRAARKRSARIRNNLQTEGSEPEYIPPDDALDKVADMLGETSDCNSAQSGGDTEEEKVQMSRDPLHPDIELHEHEPEIVINSFDIDSKENLQHYIQEKQLPLPKVIPPASSPHNKFCSKQIIGKRKRQAVSDVSVKLSVIRRNRAIADYYDAKTKREDQLSALKKKKLELEIMEYEKKFCLDKMDE